MTKSQVFLMIVVTMLIALSAGMVEAVTMCYAPSKTFHGKCKDDPQGCKAACISEGFDLGPCRGFLIQKCVCFKDHCLPLKWRAGA